MKTTTTTRPTDENITAATIRALSSGAFEPGRLERGMLLALDPRSVVLPDGAVDVPTSDGFVVLSVDDKKRVNICECKDYTGPNAHGWCKHRIAACLLVRALEAQNAATAAQNAALAQTPTPEPERPTVPALSTVNPPYKPARTKATKPTITRRKSCIETDEFLSAWR